MIFLRAESGAEATGVQMLRELRGGSRRSATFSSLQHPQIGWRGEDRAAGWFGGSSGVNAAFADGEMQESLVHAQNATLSFLGKIIFVASSFLIYPQVWKRIQPPRPSRAGGLFPDHDE
jgi:hypothetical protein